MNRLVAGASLVALLAAGCQTEAPDVAVSNDSLSGRPQNAFSSRTVPVCWEDTSQWATERALVQTSVANTWELVGGGLIQFVGWDACTPTSNSVRVRVARARAYTSQFGQLILGVPGGVTLNFTYGPEYAAGCTASDAIRLSCIAVDAVHEFGHVLAFSHEQNRKDIPASSGCTAAQLESGLDDESTVATSTLDTMYDPDSVMNYCNPRYWNRNETRYAVYDTTHFWQLSAADQQGMMVMYPPLDSATDAGSDAPDAASDASPDADPVTADD